MINVVVFKNLHWWLEEEYDVLLYSGNYENILNLINSFGEPIIVDVSKYGIILEKIDGHYADYDYFCEEVSALLYAISDDLFT